MILFRSSLDPKRTKELHRLQRVLGIRFRRLTLLNRSLVHRSYLSGAAPASVKGDNETLEFLGDAVLGLIISEELYRLYPLSEVGELAKVKAQVVSRATLAEIAQQIELDQWILLGLGETMRGEGRRSSVIGSALEAVLGAVYLDRGLAPTARLIQKLFHHQMQAGETGEPSDD